MYINDLLSEKKMSKYRLSKESGIPQTTIMDICSGKARIEKCSADTIYKLAKTLNVSMENLIEAEIEKNDMSMKRPSFELYKSSVCHLVKDKGDIDFIIDILSSDEIRTQKLQDTIYPANILLLDEAMKTDKYRKESIKNAIPELPM